MPRSPGFAARLDERMQAASSLLCVGLDPVPAKMPAGFDDSPASVARFCIEIVEATAEYACVYKPNLGFFMALGRDGLRVLDRVKQAIPSDIPVILDGKLNDLGETAKAYGRGVYDVFGFDALTVSPYMGEDALSPYLRHRGKGVLVLVKNSNPGSGDFQDLQLDNGQLLYERVAQRCNAWNDAWPADVCLVVGATYPEQLARIRELCPTLPILLPGIGAQKGDLEGSVMAGTNAEGRGLMCSASRSIMYASDTADFATAVHATARRLRDEINAARNVQA